MKTNLILTLLAAITLLSVVGCADDSTTHSNTMSSSTTTMSMEPDSKSMNHSGYSNSHQELLSAE
jgi:uncharacterized lipoprotein YajG